MNAFKRRKIPGSISADSPSFLVQSFVQVVDHSENVNVTHLEKVLETPEKLSERISLPTSKQFSLSQMLKSGVLPQEVNCNGLIQSDTVMDSAAAFERLKSMEKLDSSLTPSPEPTPQPIVEPTV